MNDSNNTQSLITKSLFFDIHYHANPDAYQRRYSAQEAGKIYQKLNGAVVLKSHLGSTIEIANKAQNEGLPVYGSLVLNKIAGGLDYKIILQAISTHRLVDRVALLVHLPTITGRKHTSKLERTAITTLPSEKLFEPETISDENHRLKPAVINILKLSLDYPIVISSGHANKIEIELLIEACIKLGVKKLILNQPANPLTGMTFEDLLPLTCCKFLWFEQTALTYLLGYQTREDFLNVLLKLPRVIYSSDLGQPSQIDIQEWYQQYQQLLVDKVIHPDKWKELIKINPEKLLTY